MTGAIDVPRGADVRLKVRVETAWLRQAATIELDLPRNLTCAACDGGGCDKCERAGAVSIRGRKDPTETLRVTLPRQTADLETTDSGRSIVVRIPERGGWPERKGLPRGILMLQVLPAEAADPSVRLVPSEIPLAEVVPEAVAAPARTNWTLIVAIAVILWILFLIWLRLSGHG